ncbi:Uncharacterised protein g5361 [Pycnogonum litorale]
METDDRSTFRQSSSDSSNSSIPTNALDHNDSHRDVDHNAKLKIDWNYLKSPGSLLLVCGLVLILAAFIFINSTHWCILNNTCNITGYTATFKAFSTVHIMVFLTCWFIHGFYTLGLQRFIKQIKETTWPLLDAGYSIFVCMMMFIVDVLLAFRTGERAAFQGAIICGTFALMLFVGRLCIQIKFVRSLHQFEIQFQSKEGGATDYIHYNVQSQPNATEITSEAHQRSSSCGSLNWSAGLENVETDIHQPSTLQFVGQKRHSFDN